MIVNHISDKGLVSKICKELVFLCKAKTVNAFSLHVHMEAVKTLRKNKKKHN